MPTKAQRQVGAWQGAISSAFGVNAWQPIASALYQASKGPQGDALATRANQVTGGTPGYEYGRFGPIGPGSEASIYSNAAQSFATQLGDLVAAGPQAVKALQDIGIKGASVSQAFDIMTEAMVPITGHRRGRQDQRPGP